MWFRLGLVSILIIGSSLHLQVSIKMAFKMAKSTLCAITGTSSGLGREIAVQFAEEWERCGAKSDVALLSRDVDGLKRTRELIATVAPNIQVHEFQVDLSDLQALSAACSRVWELYREDRHEQVALVHNAGTLGNISQPVAAQTDPEEVHEYFAVNLTSMWVMTGSFLSRFKSLPRLLINITSLAAKHPFAGLAMYCTGKAAREAFMANVAKENPDVRVLNYAPGPCDTKMIDEVIAGLCFEETRIQFETMTLQTTKYSISKLLGLLKENAFENGATIDCVIDLS